MPADGAITLVVDPEDSAACATAVTSLACLPDGRVVCHPTPGGSPAWLACDLLLALGKRFEAMTERVRADTAAFDVDADDFLGWVWSDVEVFGKRIGLADAREDGGPPSPAAPLQSDGGASRQASQGIVEPSHRAHEASRGTGQTPSPASLPEKAEPIVARCFGCLLTLICARRLAPA